MFSRVEALDSRHMGCRASCKRGTSNLKQHQRHIASYPRHVSLFAQGAALPKMGCRAASCIYSIQRESPGNHHQRTLIAGKEPGGEMPSESKHKSY